MFVNLLIKLSNQTTNYLFRQLYTQETSMLGSVGVTTSKGLGASLRLKPAKDFLRDGSSDASLFTWRMGNVTE